MSESAILPNVRPESNVMAKDDKQFEIIKNMTPEQKINATMRLYWSARELKAAWFRQEHPDWTEDQVQEAVREVFLYARS